MERGRAEFMQLTSLVLRGASPQEAVVLAWPLACGTQVAERTRAVEFADRKLIVEVPDKSWRHELAGYLPHYLHQLQNLTGVAVEEVRFVTATENKR
jgi:hypothetical protein